MNLLEQHAVHIKKKLEKLKELYTKSKSDLNKTNEKVKTLDCAFANSIEKLKCLIKKKGKLEEGLSSLNPNLTQLMRNTKRKSKVYITE
jgi:predicted  nucleic acid-binding Zn-ribbon protein